MPEPPQTQRLLVPTYPFPLQMLHVPVPRHDECFTRGRSLLRELEYEEFE